MADSTNIDFFLEISGIKGESQVDKYEGWLQLLSWSWGVDQPTTTHMGKGGGGGKVSVQDLVCTYYMDRATPDLMLASCSAEHIKDAKLVCRKAGGKDPLEYLTIEMEPVIISNVSTGGGGGDPRLLVTFSLNFGGFTLAYTEQTEKGGKGAAPECAWNIVGNCPK